MDELKKKLELNFERFKYPLIILMAGILFMLLPESKTETTEPPKTDLSVAQLLSSTKGVGEALVLISDKGVVVVCQGADNARVRLEIIQAVSSYTGYGSDKITVLKMAE